MQRVRGEIYGPRSHQRERGQQALFGQRAPIQLHHAEILPRADQPVHQAVEDEGQRATRPSSQAGERFGEASLDRGAGGQTEGETGDAGDGAATEERRGRCSDRDRRRRDGQSTEGEGHR